MQKQVRPFIDDIKDAVKKSQYNKDIISIALLGSAATGNWIKGESDIDMIIVVKSRAAKNPVNAFFAKIFKKLNKKHNIKLEKTCSTEHKSKHIILNALFKIDSFVFVGVPYRVISQDEFDIIKNRISDPKLWFIATFLGSLNSFLKKHQRNRKDNIREGFIKENKSKANIC